VRSQLAKKGIQLKSISHRLEPVPNSKTHDLNLIFDVQEDQRVAIADVDFRGNKVFSDEQLKGALSTKPEGFFWFRSGTYDEMRLRQDLRQKLPEFYGSKGYLDFAVLNDSLSVDPANGKATLIIDVSEGPQYRLASFDVEGNRRFSTDELKKYFEEESSGLLKGFGLGGTQCHGLFHKNVLAMFERRHRLRIVQRIRAGEVHRVQFVAAEERHEVTEVHRQAVLLRECRAALVAARIDRVQLAAVRHLCGFRQPVADKVGTHDADTHRLTCFRHCILRLITTPKDSVFGDSVIKEAALVFEQPLALF
jgi:hypothetical protein